jgi:hypothetical protein
LGSPSCSHFVADSDTVWWGRIADQAIAEGRHIPHHWHVEYDDGADGCVPDGWYAQGRDVSDMPIDWPVRHEYGPFKTESDARDHTAIVDSLYANKEN